jgi:quinol monooxygenase YgiN
MIVLHASFPVDPDSRDEALDLAAELVEKSNAEDGMIEYRATVDIEGENTLRFFEQRLPDLLAGEPTVRQFEVSDVSELEL